MLSGRPTRYMDMCSVGTRKSADVKAHIARVCGISGGATRMKSVCGIRAEQAATQRCGNSLVAEYTHASMSQTSSSYAKTAEESWLPYRSVYDLVGAHDRLVAVGARHGADHRRFLGSRHRALRVGSVVERYCTYSGERGNCEQIRLD